MKQFMNGTGVALSAFQLLRLKFENLESLYTIEMSKNLSRKTDGFFC